MYYYLINIKYLDGTESEYLHSMIEERLVSVDIQYFVDLVKSRMENFDTLIPKQINKAQFVELRQKLPVLDDVGKQF